MTLRKLSHISMRNIKDSLAGMKAGGFNLSSAWNNRFLQIVKRRLGPTYLWGGVKLFELAEYIDVRNQKRMKNIQCQCGRAISGCLMRKNYMN